MFRNRTFKVLGNLILLVVLCTGRVTAAPNNRASEVKRDSSSSDLPILETSKTANLPEGLSADDWAQIKVLLPAPEAPLLPAQEAYLKASATGINEYFGAALSLSGDTLVVGASGEDSNSTGVNGNQADNSATSSGAVYVFIRSAGLWSQQAYLKASNTETEDAFGFDVSLSGDTLVVGAVGEDSNATGINGNQADNSASLSGAAYIFTRSGTTWSQQAYLKASNTGAVDEFGYEVSISGDTLVIGAWGEDSNATGVNGNQANNSASGSGAAYVFARSGGVWSQQAYLKASNTEIDDSFGFAVSIFDNTLVVGAFGESSNAIGVNGNETNNSAIGSGAAYVFTRSGTTWSQQAYLKASNTGANDNFGREMSLSSDTLVIGVAAEDSSAVGINGDQGNNSAGDSGAAYIFTRSGATWSQQAYLKASNTEFGDGFGSSVSLSGDKLVVGAAGEDSNATGVNGDQSNNSGGESAGAAYFFTRTGTTWSQQAYLKASNTDMQDGFGLDVLLSDNTLIVGAYWEDSNATGVNGDQSDNSASASGAAYVFTVGDNVVPPVQKHPLILVHGWQGLDSTGFECTNDGDPTDDVQPFNGSNSNLANVPDLPTWLQQDYQVWIAHLETSSDGTPPLTNNAACLRDQIEHVYSLNPQPITIVAHSMGGVVSRAAIRFLDVEITKDMTLYTLGSPHAGIPLKINFLYTGLFDQDAVEGMDTEMMEYFNGGFSNIDGVKYVFLGGDNSPTNKLESKILYKLLTDQEHDGLVGAYSAVGWVYPDKIFQPSNWTSQSVPSQYWTDETHSVRYSSNNNYYSSSPNNANNHSDAYDCIKALMDDLLPDDQYCRKVDTSSQLLNAQAILTPSVFTELKTGHLNTSQSISVPLQIDTNVASLFYLTWSGDTPTFTLTRPNAQVINPDYAASHPAEVTYETSPGSADAPPYAAYQFSVTQPGTWQLNITATGAVDYQGFAVLESGRTLALQTNKNNYQIGDIATITANLDSGGSGLAGATVTATLTRPDDVVNVVSLTDQGNGTYTNTYTIPDTAGYLTIDVTATGSDNGTSFSRQENLLVAIAPNDLQLTGTYTDQPRDDNADGIYDFLDFSAGVNLTSPGEYAVSAELYAGDQLITQSGDFFQLVAGTQTVTLPFDGHAIYTAGLDGPYTVKNLYFTPIDIGITAASIENARTTSAYSYTQFDFIPPLVSNITRANPNQTSAASVNFTVTFSESVTNIDAGDFILTTSGISGATISGVSGSGSAYTVTVNTGVGNGTIRLDMLPSATITDLGGNPLDNLPFTSGDTYTVNKPLAAAVLTAPIGNINTEYNPAYTWNKVNSATKYRLYVSGPKGVVFDQWYESASICDATTCSATPGPTATLGGGNYSWYVQTYNAVGYGPWSNNTQPTNFSTTVLTVPAAATNLSPNSAIGTNYNPNYTWNKVAAATYYHLVVNGPSGVVIDQWYPSASICPMATCSVASPTPLGGGAYGWYVQTYNGVGYGPWSNNTQPTNFSTTIPTMPVAATNLSPNTAIGTNYNPNYTWDKVATATYYHLYVSGPNGVVLDQWYQAAAICPAATCSVASPTLGGGAFGWYVQTYNSAGYGPWSNNTQPTNFSTTMPTISAAATNLLPNTAIGTNYNPNYTWDKVATATYYRLYVSGPSGTVLDQWYQASTICPAATCSVASPTPLGGGAYGWYVQTYNSAGYGPWSNNTQPTNFSTTIPSMPAAATNLSPNTAIGTDYNPNYTWNKVAAATYYHLVVNGPSGAVLDQWYQAATICPAATCSVASPTLGGGAFGWYVQTYNSAGYGPWSNNTQPTNFSTTIPTLPAIATNLSPIGTIASHTPTYQWNRVSMATWYRLYVKGPSGLVKDQWYQAVSICNATTCSVVSPSLESGDHIWWIQPYNTVGYSPWKKATFMVSP